MNGSVPEETSKVATSLIQNLKDQPITLALVLFNMVFVAAVYFGGIDVREHQDKILGLLVEQNTKAQEMLARCIVPPRTQLEGGPTNL